MFDLFLHHSKQTVQHSVVGSLRASVSNSEERILQLKAPLHHLFQFLVTKVCGCGAAIVYYQSPVLHRPGHPLVVPRQCCTPQGSPHCAAPGAARQFSSSPHNLPMTLLPVTFGYFLRPKLQSLECNFIAFKICHKQKIQSFEVHHLLSCITAL